MALDQDVERLAAIPLLNTLEHEALRLLAFAGEARSLPGGSVLFRRGDPSDGGYIILSGSVRMSAGPQDTILGVGQLIDETALLREAARTATAIVVEPAHLFKLPRRAVLRVLEEHPGSAKRLLAYLARRLHAALPT